MKIITGLSLLLMIGSANAGMDLDFEKVKKPEGLSGFVKSRGDVCITKNAGSNVLRVAAPQANLKMKTNISSKEFTVSVDWYRTRGGNGAVFNLTDFNHNKKFLSIVANGMGNVTGSSFVTKKMKMRNLFKAKLNTWYRFELDVAKKSYSIKVTERGADNSGDLAEVVFDSNAQRKKLRTNSKVTPNILMFQQWGKQHGPNFQYDNLALND